MGDSVRASHLLVKHQGSRRPASWRDQDGSAFIKAKSKAQALAELAQFRARVVAGEDFAALAKQFSDCGSASAGGDLGVFGRYAPRVLCAGSAVLRRCHVATRRGAMQKAFEDGAFALKVGELSQGAPCLAPRAVRRPRAPSPRVGADAPCPLPRPRLRSGGHGQRRAHHPAHRLKRPRRCCRGCNTLSAAVRDALGLAARPLQAGPAHAAYSLEEDSEARRTQVRALRVSQSGRVG